MSFTICIPNMETTYKSQTDHYHGFLSFQEPDRAPPRIFVVIIAYCPASLTIC